MIIWSIDPNWIIKKGAGTSLAVWKNNPPENYGKFFGFVTGLTSTKESQLYTFFSSIPDFEAYSFWNYFISDKFTNTKVLVQQVTFPMRCANLLALGFKSYERTSPLLRTVSFWGEII